MNATAMANINMAPNFVLITSAVPSRNVIDPMPVMQQLSKLAPATSYADLTFS